MKKKGEANGDLEGRICPDTRFSSRNLSSCSCSFRFKGYTLQSSVAFALGMSLMAWSQGVRSGISLKFSLENKSRKDRYSSGTISSNIFFGFSAFAAAARSLAWCMARITISSSMRTARMASPSSSSSSQLSLGSESGRLKALPAQAHRPNRINCVFQLTEGLWRFSQSWPRYMSFVP